ncbi:cation diffusion facilitator family transporter [Neomegalonema sp.]|uniref:cation diffusion facilitator family transporter n=1 Tax=Neomegalonema sp. TaxID=2039713 RepID=UPI00262EFE2A|nr:cation diffusion facilitator family transporter [Neomegalonema sp.]MDD2869221.1 cation diffusion facilitator family transporter [Neomegalonema sp.]
MPPHAHPPHAPHTHAEGHDHGGHGHAPAVSSRNESRVLIAFGLTFGYMLVEAVGGWLSGSLALIADAGHMLTDASALALAWGAFRLARRPPDALRTYGFARFEVLTGFVNALALFGLTGWILWEAVQRLRQPAEILAGPMLVVALIGLAVNLVVLRILRGADRSHVNIRGATLHVMGDLLGSVAAIVAAVVVWATGWTPIDPILSALLSALILVAAWRLLRDTLEILLEAAPREAQPVAVRAWLLSHVEGLAAAEHLHVWSLSSGKTAATLEALPAAGTDPQELVRAIKRELAERFAIGHATVEILWSAEGEACALEAEVAETEALAAKP